jgi:hypothetical protein
MSSQQQRVEPSQGDPLELRLGLPEAEYDNDTDIQEALYPDIDDDTFLLKLLAKREFRESKQSKITNEMLKKDLCSSQEFEYTSVQRFVAQFMSPKTPYNGMLLYHNVGVGKTCTAVLTAESFLELSPKNKVYILAPPAIQPGFYRTIFDVTKLKIGEDEDTPNSHVGCTANRYLELSQTYFERDRKTIEYRVNKLINKRYSIMGYVAFRNLMRDILSEVPRNLSEEKQTELEVTLLKKAFSGSLFIVDEAHNLRDTSEVDTTDEDDTGVDERSDASAGKKLAPHLRRLLRTCDGNKLLLMTATPMYNNYKEIISLLNFLLHADHAPDRGAESKMLNETHIQFHMTPEGERLTPESEKRIIQVANGHVSFMRGENPRAFPARLDPQDAVRLKRWPEFTPDGLTRIEPPGETRIKNDVLRLPLVECRLNNDSLLVIQTLTEKLVASKGVGIRTIDTLLQAGNCVFPGDGIDGRTGSEGFQSWFTPHAVPGSFEGTRLNMLPQYDLTDATANPIWMATGRNSLEIYSPKYNLVLQSIQKARGISFVYSRFVENGAIIFCLLLEANGYTHWGRSTPMFKKGVVMPALGRQCCDCASREKSHPPFNKDAPKTRENHPFSPAYYALLTASNINTLEREGLPLSPNNPGVVNAARDPSNTYGNKIKVIVGSQVAGEGLDLKAIREIHILEGWFHLSKEEQIVGRGIRYCSHSGLHISERNCTINLYVNVFPPAINKETIDQNSYRTAMGKAVRVGHVSRALKQGAADCNLNRFAILINDLDAVPMVDSQGLPRTVDLNDRNYSPICDWIKCDYKCNPTVDLTTLKENTSTYDIYAARFSEEAVISRIKKLFRDADQVWYRWSDIKRIFKDIPEATLKGVLIRILHNPAILLENGNMRGRLVYRNDLFLFQPTTIQDTHIPIALRHGRYPIKRDAYVPDSHEEITRQTLSTKPKSIKVSVAPLPDVEATVALAEGIATTVSEKAGEPELQAELEPDAKEEEEEYVISVDDATKFWNAACNWINAWAADGTPVISIIESIPADLSTAILKYVQDDHKKKENIETRLKKLQWWGRTVADPSVPEGLKDLRLTGKQYIWDSFLKGPEQMAILNNPTAKDLADVNTEQVVPTGQMTVYRYIDVKNFAPVYLCNDAVCPPSIIQIVISSKTDTTVNARANQKLTARIYGIMTPTKNKMIFKMNEPRPEGKAPSAGSICEIVSTVKSHRMKLITLGVILHEHTEKYYDLTEESLTRVRKLTGAPNFCALMEIVMRWMDIRRARYGGLRYFYRPMASYYSGHRSKK